jgi:hypothetical protein
MAHLPDDAFGRYVAMGVGRTYEGLARLLGVSKRTVVRRAIAERWQERLAQVEEEAQRKTIERAAEDLAGIDERHLRTTRAIQARALDALKNMPINSGMSAVRALDVSVKLERAILGRGKEAGTHGGGWAQIVDDVSRAAQDREAAGPTSSAPSPAPIVPPILASRVVSEN